MGLALLGFNHYDEDWWLRWMERNFDEWVNLRLVKYTTIQLKRKKLKKCWSNKLSSYQHDVNNQDPAKEQDKRLEDKFENNSYYRLQVSLLLQVHLDYIYN